MNHDMCFVLFPIWTNRAALCVEETTTVVVESVFLLIGVHQWSRLLLRSYCRSVCFGTVLTRWSTSGVWWRYGACLSLWHILRLGQMFSHFLWNITLILISSADRYVLIVVVVVYTHVRAWYNVYTRTWNMFVLYRHVCLYTWRTYPGQPHITLGGNQHIGWVSCSTILRVSGCSGHAPRCRLACLRRFLFVCSSAAASSSITTLSLSFFRPKDGKEDLGSHAYSFVFLLCIPFVWWLPVVYQGYSYRHTWYMPSLSNVPCGGGGG